MAVIGCGISQAVGRTFRQMYKRTLLALVIDGGTLCRSQLHARERELELLLLEFGTTVVALCRKPV